MKKSKAASPPTQRPAKAADRPLHRSGAVARMVRMPVATLRVWERRYALTQPALSSGGQRLYSAADVRRLGLLKLLTERGHAIGTLAALDMAQLQQVASTHAQAMSDTMGDRRAIPEALLQGAWRVAVIGAALGARLRRPALLRRLGRPLVVLGPFADARQAAAATQGVAVDALLIQETQLHADWLASMNAVAPALASVPKAVLYGFAAEAVCEALATAGTALLREPQGDAVLAQWLRSLCMQDSAAPLPRTAVRGVALSDELMRPRRWDDAALADFANLSSTIACECPRHVAELLMQLSNFEAYSAGCEHRNVADAELHVHLRQAAAASRIRFEAALEHVAMHEGMVLPP